MSGLMQLKIVLGSMFKDNQYFLNGILVKGLIGCQVEPDNCKVGDIVTFKCFLEVIPFTADEEWDSGEGRVNHWHTFKTVQKEPGYTEVYLDSLSLTGVTGLSLVIEPRMFLPTLDLNMRVVYAGAEHYLDIRGEE